MVNNEEEKEIKNRIESQLPGIKVRVIGDGNNIDVITRKPSGSPLKVKEG